MAQVHLSNCHNHSLLYTRVVKSIILTVALGASAMILFSACKGDPAHVEPAATTGQIASNPPVAGASARNENEILKGRWQRGDGDYLIEIRDVDAGGKMDAGYFNPSPIKVSQARAYAEGGAQKIFVELRDVNYPGCTYKLTYDAKKDQLLGQYYQASMQETYEVAFARVK